MVTASALTSEIGGEKGQAMFDKVRRHFNQIQNSRELNSLDPWLCADIGLSCGHDRRPARPPLLLPLGPGERTHR